MPIRVLVVDDSVVFRTKLQLSLSKDPALQVVGCAVDAADAMKRIEELNPDVVTLDVEMPKMNGIDFLKRLIPLKPIPVVVVSAMPINALDAMDAGAVDYVRKPAADPNSLRIFLEELNSKIKIASKAKVRSLPTASSPSLAARLSQRVLSPDKNTVIAIGASTGGTEAILEVIKDLPATTPGIVVVQHMPATFTALYAQRLDKICHMRVREAKDFDRVLPGQVIIGAGNFHLTLKKDSSGYYVNSRPGEKVSGHCPSVDVLFNSVADTAGAKAVGIILTGMGADGARGLTKMRQKGAYTIGQDKDSCVVYGMPMEAHKMGGVVRQFPLNKIGDEIIYHISRR